MFNPQSKEVKTHNRNNYIKLNRNNYIILTIEIITLNFFFSRKDRRKKIAHNFPFISFNIFKFLNFDLFSSFFFDEIFVWRKSNWITHPWEFLFSFIIIIWLPEPLNFRIFQSRSSKISFQWWITKKWMLRVREKSGDPQYILNN